MGLCILESSLLFSAQGGWDKEKNCKPAVKNFVSPSQGEAVIAQKSYSENWRRV